MTLLTSFSAYAALVSTATPDPVQSCVHVPTDFRVAREQYTPLGSVRTVMGDYMRMLRGTPHGSPPPVPDIVDYRHSYRVVTPVKDQGDCGSCWAFSSAESLEGQMGLNGNAVNLSAQNFVDCVTIDNGCGGGWMDDALAYAEKNGVENETAYPYTGVGQDCGASPSETTVRPAVYVNIPPTDAALREALVTVGPVSIALDATFNFQMYNASDYIFTDPTCDASTPDHALLLVGYNRLEGYWIVKNSWNTDWGRDGYIYINSSTPNACGISEYAVVPYIPPRTAAEKKHRLWAHLDSIPHTDALAVLC